MGPLLMGVAALFVAALGIVIVFVTGLRAKASWVRDRVRRFNRAVGNPMQMKSAGTPGAYASVIRHQGRTSGRWYQTPVVAAETEDGFVIAIVYGSRTDWLKNVLANGSATIVHDGQTYLVDHPEVVPIGMGDPYFPRKVQRTHRRFRIEECLRLRRADVAKTPAA